MSIVKAIKSIGTSAGVLATVDPRTYRGQMAELFLPGGQGPLRLFTYSDNNSSLNAYEQCPPLTAIINKKAQAYINGKTWIMNPQGKQATTPFANKLRKLLAQPNPLQTWKQFDAQNYIYQQIFGWCIVLPIKPVGFKDNVDASSIWNIPGSMLSVTETNKLWYQTDLSGIIEKIVLSYRGVNTPLKLEDIHIFRDICPSFSSQIFPESRIRSLEMPINNIIGAYESRNVLINYRGALGILTPDIDKVGYIPIKDPDKVQLQKDFARYGLKSQQWKFIISSAAVKWQQMGIPTRDLMLFEEIEDDMYRCSDSYNYPAYLLAGSKGGTYSNVGEAKTSLYQDTIIPEGENINDQWNRFFKCTENGVEIQKDYSHIPALQADKLKEAQARNTLGQELEREFKNNMIKLNRVLELLGEDTVPGMDKYYNELLAAGYTFGPVTAAPKPPPGQEEEQNTDIKP